MDLIHMDIYAIVEATQELHFGNVKDLNINRVELITLPKDNGVVIQKPYMSPTKVRGVARRALLWELTSLGDQKVTSCGIPATCGKCDVCRLFGAIPPENMGSEAIQSRIIQAGGVAIQELSPEIKQRNSVPTYIIDGKIGQYDAEKIKEILEKRGISGDDLNRLSSPMPYGKEYITGIFPIYWHAFCIEKEKQQGSQMSEPQMIAFSFLETLKRVGASHPKGAYIKEGDILSKEQPLLVVDVYRKPLGTRPVISPMEVNENKALETFKRKALTVAGKQESEAHIKVTLNGTVLFERFIGEKAHAFLQKLAGGLETDSTLLGAGT